MKISIGYTLLLAASLTALEPRLPEESREVYGMPSDRSTCAEECLHEPQDPDYKEREALIIMIDASPSVLVVDDLDVWNAIEKAISKRGRLTLVAVVCFGGPEAALLLPPQERIDDPKAQVQHVKRGLSQYIARLGEHSSTLLLPGLRIIRSLAESNGLTGGLVVTVSDGLFWDDKAEWLEAREELVRTFGFSFSSAFSIGRGSGRSTGYLNMRELARVHANNVMLAPDATAAFLTVTELSERAEEIRGVVARRSSQTLSAPK